jgi:hypothetical protein
MNRIVSRDVMVNRRLCFIWIFSSRPSGGVGHITSGRYHWVCVGALTETKTGVPDFSRFSRSRPLAANAQAGVFKLFSTQGPTPRYRGYFNIRVIPQE